jgi:hypothetical protein
VWQRLLRVHGGHRQRCWRTGEYVEGDWGERERGDDGIGNRRCLSESFPLLLSSLPAENLCTPISISQVMSVSSRRRYLSLFIPHGQR